jgi:hypothetical protein
LVLFHQLVQKLNFVYFYVLKIFFKEFKEFYFIFILN